MSTSNDLLIAILSVTPVLLVTLAFLKMYQMRTRELVALLTKEVKEIGGTEIKIERLVETNSNRANTMFKVVFIGSNGHLHSILAWRIPGEMPKNTFRWEPSLDVMQIPRSVSSSTSKEQIISDMAAEIEVLKKRLDSAENTVGDKN